MKKILQIGTTGQLGWELLRACAPLGEVVGLDYPEVDLSDRSGLREVVRKVAPDIIINAAAYTNVDKAEDDAEMADKINHRAVKNLAEVSAKHNLTLIHISTDYVFDGSKNTPYLETDPTAPLGVYGRTKLAGEKAVTDSGCDYLIIRTSWLYSSFGNN